MLTTQVCPVPASPALMRPDGVIGYKTLDGMSDFWADHDERCHGRCSSFIDDPDYVDGFMWSCCERAMNERGCEQYINSNTCCDADQWVQSYRHGFNGCCNQVLF